MRFHKELGQVQTSISPEAWAEGLDPSRLHSDAWRQRPPLLLHAQAGDREYGQHGMSLGVWDLLWASPGRGWTGDPHAGARTRHCFGEQGTPGCVHTPVAFKNLDQHLDCCFLLISFAVFLHRVRAAFINDTSFHEATWVLFCLVTLKHEN